MASICNKCGTKEILMVGHVYGVPDSEPYESGIEEETEVSDCEVPVHFQYCPECNKIDVHSVSDM